MGVIEAIRKGFGVATKNLGLVLVLFVFNLIWNLASIPFVGTTAAANQKLSVAAVALSMVFILASIFVQGGALGLVRDYIKEGKMKLASFAKYGLKYYVKLLGLGLIIVLVIAIVGLLAALIVMTTTPLNNTIITTIAAIIAIVVGAIGLYFILLLILSPYAIICDESSIIGSMKTSLKVVRQSLLKVLLLLVVLVLISLGLGFILGFVTGLVTVALPAQAGQVIIGVINSIFNGYLGIVMMASFMGFYLALKVDQKAA